jgi:hypothetical protein
MRAALPEAGIRARGQSVSLDHPDEQIKKKLAFGRRERRKNTRVRGLCLWINSLPERLALGGEVQLARAAVSSVDTALDKAHRLQPVDGKTGFAGIDAHGRREATLIDSGLDLEINERSILQLANFLASELAPDNRCADLLKAPR